MKLLLVTLIALFFATTNAAHCIHKRVHVQRRNQNIQCPNGYVMRGMHRNRVDNLSGITHLWCCKLPGNGGVHRHTQNWVRSFDHRGWSTCHNGWFMNGFRKSRDFNLYNIEYGLCQRRSAPRYQSCYTERSIVGALDRPGWAICRRGGYYMAGMWRNTHNRRDRNRHRLHRIEYFKCCKPKVNTRRTRNIRPRNGCLNLFRHYGYQGTKWGICHSRSYHQLFRHGGRNDQVSSFCAGHGANWRLYEHNFSGRSVYVKSGQCGNVPSWFNDKLSSVRKYPKKRKRTCRIIKRRICRRVRRKPYYKLQRYRKAYYVYNKIVRKRRVRYKQAVCRNRRVRVAYTAYKRYRKRVPYRASRTYRKYYWHYYNYYQRVRRRKRVSYKQKYTVRVRKRFRVAYKVRKVRVVWKNVRSICFKKYKKKLSRKVWRPYNTKCRKRVWKIEFRRRKVWTTKSVKVKYWLRGRYRRVKKDCFKKVYGYKWVAKRVQVWRRVPVRVLKTVVYPCVKRKLVTVYYWRHYVKRFRCTKRRKAYKFYYVTRYRTVYRYVRQVRYRTKYRWHYYWTRVKKRGRKRRFRVLVKHYTAYRYVYAAKRYTAYRYVNKTYTTYVWKYKWKYYVQKRRQRRYKYAVKRVSVKYYTNKCTVRARKVCK